MEKLAEVVDRTMDTKIKVVADRTLLVQIAKLDGQGVHGPWPMDNPSRPSICTGIHVDLMGKSKHENEALAMLTTTRIKL
jgi:hypothetical protein